jgi:exopolyphosphatase/guanosine-5'-triphosphate,3'-diphosphate pyrophosphatase
MRVAIIDLGTNSVRFDVHQLGPGNKTRQLHREKLMVRLGQGVFLDGKLDAQAIRRTLEAFGSFQRTAKILHSDKIIAFGTSALREAVDSAQLLKGIRSKTGIEVRVISGAEEARLIALGILAHEKAPKGKFGLIDIGGGSTEISIVRGGEILNSESFPLGTARLQQVFLKSSPPKSPDAVKQLRRYIKSVLLPPLLADGWPKVPELIASSGTARALARIVQDDSSARSFETAQLSRLVRTMSTMTTTQLLGLPQMEAKRVDMILAGAVLMEECLEALSVRRVRITDFSLRDGILEEQLQIFQTETKSSPLEFHLPDLAAKAHRFGVQVDHIQAVGELCDALFMKTARLHRLKPKWKMYLSAAAILHDLGEAVTPTNHEQHSYYIVKHADFPSMDPWETEFIARMCLHHRGGLLKGSDLDFVAKNKAGALRRDAFPKLVALLRIADALDRNHQGSVKISAVRMTRKEVVLKLRARGPIDLEILRVEQKKELFEQIFERDLRIEMH